MVDLMGESPFDFVMSHSQRQLTSFDGFVHRTFNHTDLKYFLLALQNIYRNKGGLEYLFTSYAKKDSLQGAIHQFKNTFFELPHPARTAKHISDPLSGSAAKRLNMYLRWMVRNDKKGVDFGLWKTINPSKLSCPLDVHSGNTARELGLLKRTYNDAKAVAELDKALREFDPLDPAKYDFALFGISQSKKLEVVSESSY